MNKAEKNIFFTSETASLDKKLNDLQEEVKTLQSNASKSSKLKAYYNIRIIYIYLQSIELLSEKSVIHNKIFTLGHPQSLETARKYLGYIFSSLQENIYSSLKFSFTEISTKLDQIPSFNPQLRVHLFSYMIDTIVLLEKLIGQNSKWKWTFPNFWYELSIILHNVIHYKEATSPVDPNDPFIKYNQELIDLYKKTSFHAATELRSRFELSTQSANDLIKGINLLLALKKVMSFLKMTQEIPALVNRIDVLKILAERRGKMKKEST